MAIVFLLHNDTPRCGNEPASGGIFTAVLDDTDWRSVPGRKMEIAKPSRFWYNPLWEGMRMQIRESTTQGIPRNRCSDGTLPRPLDASCDGGKCGRNRRRTAGLDSGSGGFFCLQVADIFNTALDILVVYNRIYSWIPCPSSRTISNSSKASNSALWVSRYVQFPESKRSMDSTP